MMTAYDTYLDEYKRQISSWDWAAIRADALYYSDRDDDDPDRIIGRSFIGTVMRLYPSGKYYMPWCSNCPEEGSEEAERDEAFSEALEAIASEHGGWVESGEGDPCDLFAAWDFTDEV